MPAPWTSSGARIKEPKANAEILTLIITAATLGIITLAALAVIKALEYAIKAIMRKGRR